MYKIGTKVPFSGVIVRVDTYSYGELKGKTIYTIKDEHGVDVRLEEKDVKKLIED